MSGSAGMARVRWRSSSSSSAFLAAMAMATVAASTAPPPSPAGGSDSVYASTAGGFEQLSGWNRMALLSTIVVFLLLSVLSGRELWVQRYGRRGRSAPAATNGTSHPSTSSISGGNHFAKSSSYATPKQSGTPSTAPLHSTGSGNGSGAVGVSSSSGLLDDDSGAALSTGAEMRQRFFVLLFAASTIRVVSLVVEITTLRVMVTSPAASLYSRLLSMFLWIPALLFVSMYGLVLLFWAQLCYACWGKAYPWPRRVFFAFNVLLYVVFVILLFATSTSGSFWRACDVLLGSVYVMGFVGILYYSVRLIQFFRLQGPDEDFFFDQPNHNNSSGSNSTTPAHRRPLISPRQMVLTRITAVCVLLSVLFVVKASYLVGLGIGFVPSEETQYRSPVGVHHLAFEFSMHFFTEFVPCAVLLFFTRKQQNHSPEPTPQQGGAGGAGGSGGVTPGTSASGLHHNHHHSGLPSHSGGGLRGRNNSSHSAYQDDQSVGSGSFTGYQFQAVQRSYGASFGSTQRAANGAYQSLDAAAPPSNSNTTTTPNTSSTTSYA